MHTKWNHKVILLIVITFLAAATLAMSASWSTGFGLFASAAPSRAGETPLVVLYDQNNNAGSQSTSTQNFETAFDTFDDFLGDDFVVPAGQSWNVNQIAAGGVYFNGVGPATSFNAIIYPDAAGFPGPTATCTRNAAAFTSAAGVFTVTVSPDCVLTSGTYWVVLQANMDSTVAQWGWTDRTVQSNNGAVWRNPGGGFANANCTANWGRRGTTIAAGGCEIDPGVPDQLFQVLGTLVGGPSPSPSPSPTPSPTPTPGTCGTYVQSTGTGATIDPGTTLVPGSSCDDCSNPVTLPFAFLFFGTPFTTVNAVSNGNLQFTSTDSTFTNSCLPNPSMIDAILPHWDDLLLTDVGQGIFTSTTGVAPNRIVNIEWRGDYFSGGGPVDLEARLYEGSGRIDFIYGSVPQSGSSATVGLQKDTGSVINEFECDAGGLSAGMRITYTCAGAGGTPSPTPSPSPSVSPSPCQTTFSGAITAGDPTQTDRLFRGGIPSGCGTPNACALFGDATPRHYDSYTSVNTTGATACVTATLTTACTGTNFIFAGSYLNSFNPANICTNNIGDSGSSPDVGVPAVWSFNVPAGATFVNVIAEVTANAGCSAYTLDLAGIPCGTPLPSPTPSPFTPSPSPTPSPTPCTTNYTAVSTTGATIVPGTTDTGNHIDDGTTAITLPFTYNHYGQPFTTANVDSNGTLQFTSSTSTFTNACLPDAGRNNTIYPHWDDLRTDQTGAGCATFPGAMCGIFTSTSGSTPNRIFNIEWRAVYFGTPASTANFELRLYEGQDRFDVIYGTLFDGGASATVGVEKDTGSVFTQYECNTGGLSAGQQLAFTLGTSRNTNPVAECVTERIADTESVAVTERNAIVAVLQHGVDRYEPERTGRSLSVEYHGCGSTPGRGRHSGDAQ